MKLSEQLDLLIMVLELKHPDMSEGWKEIPEQAAKLEARLELLEREYSAICTKCGYMRPATEKENERLRKGIRKAADGIRMNLSRRMDGEYIAKMVDELDALLEDYHVHSQRRQPAEQRHQRV